MGKINGLSEVTQDSDTIKINELISLRYQLDTLGGALENIDKKHLNFYTKIQEACKVVAVIQELLGEMNSITIQESREVMQIAGITTKKYTIYGPKNIRKI